MQADHQAPLSLSRRARLKSADYDFGMARNGGALREASKGRPGLAAVLLGAAFALSLLVPVKGHATAPSLAQANWVPASEMVTPAIAHDLPAPVEVRGHKGSKLPNACAIRFDDRRNARTWYVSSCLRKHGVRSDVARQCNSEALIYGRNERLVDGECLRGPAPHGRRDDFHQGR